MLSSDREICAVALCCVLSSAGVPALGQWNMITATVRDAQARGIAGASGTLRGERTFESVSNNEGILRFEAPPGRYELNVRKAGFEVYRQSVEVPVSGGANIPVTLEAATLRQAITVQADTGEGYVQPETFAATRSLTPLRDLPQSVQVITSEVLQEQQAFRFTDLYRNASGVNAFSHYNDFTARGLSFG